MSPSRPDVPRVPRTPAICAFCGYAAGNGQGVAVFRYPLIRAVKIDGRKTSRCIASLGLCDRCILEHAHLSRTYRRAQERVAS